MKDALAKLFGPRVTAYAAKADDKDEGTTLQAMLTPMANGNNPLGKMWDEYAAYVKDFAPNLPDAKKAEIDAEVQAAKMRFDRWLNDQDMYTGELLPKRTWPNGIYTRTPAPAGKLARSSPIRRKQRAMLKASLPRSRSGCRSTSTRC